MIAAMSLSIQRVFPQDLELLQQLTRRHIDTVLEICPEFGGSEAKAVECMPAFAEESLFLMFRMGVALVDYHRFWVLLDEDRVVGHWIASMETDFVGQEYGYLYSLGLLPEYRQQGWAQVFWEKSCAWWQESSLDYISAETHVDNLPIQRFLQRRGFENRERRERFWPYFVWRKTEARESGVEGGN